MQPLPEQDALELATSMAVALANDGAPHNRCIYGEPVFIYYYDKALVPGHIYSEAGRHEYGISRCCEFHFDEMSKEVEAEEYNV